MKILILFLVILLILFMFRFLNKITKKNYLKKNNKIVDLEKDPKTNEYKPKE
tara:strand:- start:2245 stop:2400 length:156 start_codon:yes stop_codon:yes gene_type:complete